MLECAGLRAMAKGSTQPWFMPDMQTSGQMPETTLIDWFHLEVLASLESKISWTFERRRQSIIYFLLGKNPNSLSSIRTSKLVPVDLNAFLCQAEGLMSDFSRLGIHIPPGNEAQAAKYRALRAQRMAAMQAILWDEKKGAWFDYDLEKKEKNPEFYPTNLTPLWASCFSDETVADKALKYLEDSQILTYKFGIPSSLRNTGQQWDFPNAWAPLQDLVIRGRKSQTPGCEGSVSLALE
ncbi:trehalase-like [Erinaceus europaeus]|uniref:Trehalase n=1 Tax=Erinaceus europaeus TaxID=9365 RepID=A0ABM3WH11_ERIEU|nr:trehalase-like [Erinaceus europaeus]